MGWRQDSVPAITASPLVGGGLIVAGYEVSYCG